jgi:hypothetical protein
MLDFLAKASHPSCHALLQQYQANSPHIHEKGNPDHIRRMIAESLGSFSAFEHLLTPTVLRHLRKIQRELELAFVVPRIYPPLETLAVQTDAAILEPYRPANVSAAWKPISLEPYRLVLDTPTPVEWEDESTACG